MLQGDSLEAVGKIFGVGGIGLAALWLVLRTKPWKNGNGYLKEDRFRLILGEEMSKTRHHLRDEMRVMADAFAEDMKDFREEIRNRLL